MNPNTIIAVDFDGTCVTHEFPKVGRDVGAAPILKEFVEHGTKLILWTMRSDGREDQDNPNPLSDAVKWFKDNDIPLWGINSNPEQHIWTGSPKAYAHIYIDDAALGVPLIHGQHDRPYVDWDKVRSMILFPKK